MSVVGSDWEALKRFNLAEIHRCRALKESQPITGAANPKAVTANEAHGKADMARAAHE
jgi:tRNA acetyltransferase TAN1